MIETDIYFAFFSDNAGIKKEIRPESEKIVKLQFFKTKNGNMAGKCCKIPIPALISLNGNKTGGNLTTTTEPHGTNFCQ